jgi:tungstate transport system substrate-binding protein
MEMNVPVEVTYVPDAEAFALGRAGDVDLLLVGDAAAAETFAAQGYGLDPVLLMYTECALVGSLADTADLRRATGIADAFARIAQAGAPFVSRGDGSGVHLVEQGLWERAGVTPQGAWYISAEADMQHTLTQAAEREAYTLGDLPSYLAAAEEGIALQLMYRTGADSALTYVAVAVDPARFPDVRAAKSEHFALWLGLDGVRAFITGFTINGVPVYYLDPGAPPAPE